MVSAEKVNLNAEKVPTAKETLKFFIEQFKNSLRGNMTYREDQLIVERGMLTKAWVIHTANTTIRCIFALTGISSWQVAYENYKDNPIINQEFVASSEMIIKTCMVCMIIVGLTLDIIVWRYRHLAVLLLYYELAMFTTMSFIPYDLDKALHYNMGFVFIIMMVECRYQPISTAIVTGVILFGTQPRLYLNLRGPAWMLVAAFSIMYTYVICLVGSLQLTYIATIRGKM